MSRKGGNGGYRPSFEGKMHRNNNVGADDKARQTAVSGGEGMDAPKINMENIRQTPQEKVVRDNRIPQPPPNYRGMIYDGFMDGVDGAEGLDRLVKNDRSYSEYEKMDRENGQNKAETVSVMNETSLDVDESCDADGLNRLVDGLKTRKFSSEDILLCAMILLMLNTASDDDILMILVLAMLL